MRKNYFQDVKIADKLKMIMKAIFAILLVNNILFAILMLVFGHPVWIIIPVIAVVGMPLLSKKIIQELTQNILEPLDQIEKAADDMSHGNLEIDIPYQGEDELGKLAESFRNTSFYLRGVVDDINQLLTEFAKGNFDARSHDIEAYQGNFGEILKKLEATENNLSQTIKDVQESSNQVSAGADQLAQSAQGLAEGATDQAAAVQQLTSSVAEVATHIEENTKSTDSVHDQAKRVAIKAASGSAKMKELVAAMQHISANALSAESLPVPSSGGTVHKKPSLQQQAASGSLQKVQKPNRQLPGKAAALPRPPQRRNTAVQHTRSNLRPSVFSSLA